MKSHVYNLSILVVGTNKKDIVNLINILRVDYNSLVELIDLTTFMEIEELSLVFKVLDLNSDILDQVNIYLQYDLILIISPLKEVIDICRVIKKAYINIRIE